MAFFLLFWKKHSHVKNKGYLIIIKKQINKKTKIKKKSINYLPQQQKLKSVALWLVLLVAITAVHWSSFCWLKRNFCFSSAVRTSYLVHFAWPKISSLAKSHSLFTFCIHFVKTTVLTTYKLRFLQFVLRRSNLDLYLNIGISTDGFHCSNGNFYLLVIWLYCGYLLH